MDINPNWPNICLECTTNQTSISVKKKFGNIKKNGENVKDGAISVVVQE